MWLLGYLGQLPGQDVVRVFCVVARWLLRYSGQLPRQDVARVFCMVARVLPDG